VYKLGQDGFPERRAEISRPFFSPTSSDLINKAYKFFYLRRTTLFFAGGFVHTNGALRWQDDSPLFRPGLASAYVCSHSRNWLLNVVGIVFLFPVVTQGFL